MRREKWLTLLSGALLAFLLSFACALCIVTAFELQADELVDLRALAVWCALISLLCGIFNSFRYGGVCIAALLAALSAYLWFYGALESSFEALCHTISIRYNNAYHWGVLRWSGADLQTVDRTMALQLIGTVVAMVTAWTVCRKRSAVWAIFAGLLPLLLCTIITTTVPTREALFLWLLAIILLLITQPSRKRNTGQANRLTLYILLPVILALALLFWLIPQEEYSHDVQAERILNKVETLLNGPDVAVGTGNTDAVDLTKVGRRSQSFRPVMDVTVPHTDTYYLRGRAFDVYTGTQWLDSGTHSNLPWQETGQDLGRVTIKTEGIEDVFYLPYFTDFMAKQQIGNVLRNDDGIKEYSYDCFASASDGAVHAPAEADIQAMTALPDATRRWAQAYLTEILNEPFAVNYVSEERTALQICNYLRDYARYDLNTPRMGSAYTDFARWFLTESASGYCVHYATAAVVLLRAAGIPARYVTGFTFEAKAGETVSVPKKNAHAWVEYWTAASGWQILDPTPAAPEEIPTEMTGISTEETTQDTSISWETTAGTESTGEDTPGSSSVTAAPPQTQAEAAHDFTAVLQVLRWLIYVLLSVGLLLGQWKLRVFLRRRARQRGTLKARTLCCWRQTICYARVLGEKPAPELRALALEAKFSDHELKVENLQQFEDDYRRAVSILRTKSPLLRLIYRLILALY